ncbi:collectin-11 [Plakobranchus ocellatus]|uniref:Collectin-11 n=1 Tax=Plakobranchus ocellatus TaxID=259542 RepID=A0AAV4A3Y1_9GAST|nr:collectin-11 [Plakobranchus ocellatus]
MLPAMMSRMPISVLLVVLMVSLGQGEDKSVTVDFIEPLSVLKDKVPVEVTCSFSRSGTGVKSTKSLTLLRSKTYDNPSYETVVTVTPGKVDLGLSETEITASGKITRWRPSELSVKYSAPNTGYCYFYKCVAEGVDKKGETKTLFKTIPNVCLEKPPTDAELLHKIGAADEAVEELKETMGQCCSELKTFAEHIKANEEKIQELYNKVSLSFKMSAIDLDQYVLSDIFRDSVYVISRVDASFELEKNNQICKEMGGYLAEVDDREEEDFLGNFATETAGKIFVYIGINDVEKEGEYVYYTSKKPLVVANFKWWYNNPDDYNKNEDCMNVDIKGLNDLDCFRKARFMCEIPLH